MRKSVINILLLLTSVIVTLLLLEGIVRIFHLAPDSEDISTKGLIFSTNPRLRYTMKPGGIWTRHRTVININEDGYRGKVISPVEKDDGTVRVLSLGDSITLGLYLEDEDTFCYQLEDLLNEQKLFGKRWEVLNFGVNGYNTINEVELLKVRGLKYRPDLVILQYCYNDHDNKSELDMRLRPTLLYHRKLIYLMLKPSLGLLRKSKLFLFCALKLNAFKVDLNDTVQAGSDYHYPGDLVARGLSELKGLSREYGFMPLVLIFPRFETEHRRFSDYREKYTRVAQLCQKIELPFINLLDYFIANYSDESTYPNFHLDSCHPTAYGNKVVSEAIVDKLKLIGSGYHPVGD